jgi:hypothetical protein
MQPRQIDLPVLYAKDQFCHQVENRSPELERTLAGAPQSPLEPFG